MKSFLKFVLIFTCILFFSAVLAPLLFKFLPFKFERIFNRLVMIFTLAAVFFFVRIRWETLKEYGLTWQKDSARMLWTAFFAGFFILVVLAMVRLATGSVVWSPSNAWFLKWIWRVIRFVFSGLLIGLIEEFFFRGFVFTSFRKRLAWALLPSLLVTNVFYSLVHFIGDYSPFIGPEPTFRDSLKLISAPFSAFADWQALWPRALGLLIFGLVLNDLVLRTKSLYPAIGLHAGCVFFVKLDGYLVDFSNPGILIGSGAILDGVLGWGFLILLGGALRMIIKRGNHSLPLFICLLFLLVAATEAPSAKITVKPQAEDKIYRFIGHLSKAEASHVRPGKKDETATWNKGAFQFLKPGPDLHIKSRALTIDGKVQKGIYIQPVPKTVRRLRFSDVSPGQKLLFHYGVDDKAAATPPNANIYVRIWLGKHELKRIQAPNEKGWKMQEIDLGIVSFLKKDLIVTFEVTTDSSNPLPFIFLAEVRP